jgi:hypothetical protein
MCLYSKTTGQHCSPIDIMVAERYQHNLEGPDDIIRDPSGPAGYISGIIYGKLENYIFNKDFDAVKYCTIDNLTRNRPSTMSIEDIQIIKHDLNRLNIKIVNNAISFTPEEIKEITDFKSRFSQLTTSDKLYKSVYDINSKKTTGDITNSLNMINLKEQTSLPDTVSFITSTIGQFIFTPIINALVSNIINNIIGNLFGDEKQDQGLQQIMKYLGEIMNCLDRINQNINQLRREINIRFDTIELQLKSMLYMIEYSVYILGNDIKQIGDVLLSSEKRIINRLQLIQTSIDDVQDMMEKGFEIGFYCQMNNAITNYITSPARIGKSIESDKLIETAILIENIINKPLMLEWINKFIFVNKKHTEDIDNKHFKNVSYHKYIGWFLSKNIIPSDFLINILSFYLLIINDLINRKHRYDIDNIILSRMITILEENQFIIISGDVIKKNTEQIVQSMANIDLIVTPKIDELYTLYGFQSRIIDPTIMSKFDIKHTDIIGGFDGFSGCCIWDCNIGDSNYPFTNRIQMWIKLLIEAEKRSFLKNYCTNLVVEPIDKITEKCGVQDLPLLFPKSILPVSLKPFMIAEQMGLGQLRYKYLVEWNMTTTNNMPNLNYIDAADLFEMEMQVSDGCMGKKLKYNFIIQIWWHSKYDVPVIIMKLESNIHESVPISRDNGDIVGERDPQIWEKASKMAQQPHAANISFVHDNYGNRILHPFWSLRYVEFSTKKTNIFTNSETDLYLIFKQKIIVEIEKKKKQVYDLIIEECDNDLCKIRSSLRWLSKYDEIVTEKLIDKINSFSKLFVNKWDIIDTTNYKEFKREIDSLDKSKFIPKTEEIEGVKKLIYPFKVLIEIKKNIQYIDQIDIKQENILLKQELFEMHQKLNKITELLLKTRTV